MARDLLHDWDGALTNERDGHRVGADAVARDAAHDEWAFPNEGWWATAY